MAEFMNQLATEAKSMDPNLAVTENGAVGYRTTGKSIVDLNFAASSMRNMTDDEIWFRFLAVYNENRFLAMIWLFFARDPRGGMGERRIFRVIFTRMCYENSDLAFKLLPLIPEYGRWDDLVMLMGAEISLDVRREVKRIISGQLEQDLKNMSAKKPISLLAKWMPSLNTSSKPSRRLAEEIRKALGYSHQQYRRTLFSLRNYLKVVEKSMSSKEWDQIDYSAVPSRASMIYRDAFARHDAHRYAEYLSNVKSGEEKINAGVLFPYDIVRAYMATDDYGWEEGTKPYNETLEQQWKALPYCVPDGQSTLVVVDGSGSMSTRVGKTNTTCHDVARSLGIYFAEKLTGPYKDTFITFSSSPRVITLNPALSLKSKIDILIKEDECSNTNLKATFDLILNTAVKNHLKQSDLPANILIVSDGEFDGMTYGNGDKKRLFERITEEYEEAGYKLPRLVFWNVCSRTGTIPVIENDYGVALVSGFSPTIADMVMSSRLDPAECLMDKLMSDRYKPVREAMGDLNG